MSNLIENSFPEKQISESELESWFSAGQNVLLVGEAGCGKTERICNVFNKMYGEGNWAYFSCSTIDPFLELYGIPKVAKEKGGSEVIEFVRPKALSENVRAIYFDEYNRGHKLVTAATMELIQKKSINGVVFPNLEVIAASINPPNEDTDDSNYYHVQEGDPAQLDRFHIRVRVPSQPYAPWFKNKHGANGGVACAWWKQQPKQAQKVITARRLDYVLEAYKKGVNIQFLLPENSQVQDLVSKLSVDTDEEKYFTFKEEPIKENFLNLIKNADDFKKYKENLVRDGFYNFFQYLDEEVLTAEIDEDSNFGAEVMVYAAMDMHGLKPVMETLKLSELASKWDKVARQIGRHDPSEVFDSNYILPSDKKVKDYPPNWAASKFKDQIEGGGKGWRTMDSNSKIEFLKDHVVGATDVNWHNEKTREEVLGCLAGFCGQMMTKENLQYFYDIFIKPIVFTCRLHGVPMSHPRMEEIQENFKRLDQENELKTLEVRIRDRVRTQVVEILEA